jgi:SAM-dependent methyltransferase
MKRFLIKLLTVKIWCKQALLLILRVNQISYALAGTLASVLEPDGLHPKHRITQYHQWFVDHIEPNWIVLDVGCGQGIVAQALAEKAKKVIGIEINPESYKIAAQLNEPNIQILQGDATTHSLIQNEKVDAVIMSNVLEHIDDRINFLIKMKNIADRLLIRIPMIDRDWLTLYKKEHELPWKLNSGHYIEYTEKSFHHEIETAGLKIVETSIQFGEIWAFVIKA